MSERRQLFRLGLFVFLSLGLLAGMVLFFGGAPSWFKPTHHYTINFSDAPGIGVGTPVRKSGVKVGEVTSVDLDDNTGEVRVGVNLDPKFTPRTSDEPTVTRGLIVGDTAIDFIPKVPVQPGAPIPPNSVIAGVSPFNARVLIDQATGVVPEAQRTMEQVRKSLEAFEALTPQFQATLKEFSDLARAGREFVPELRRTNDGLRDLFGGAGEPGGEIRGLIPELRKTNDEARYFLKTASFWLEEAGITLKTHEPRIAKAIDTLTITTQRIGEVFTPDNQKTFSEFLKNANRVAIQTEDFMKDARGTLKTLNGTLMQADQAMTELRQLTRPLSERVPRILQNFETGTEQFNRAMVDIATLIKAVGNSEGAFQRFIADPAFYNNLNDTVANINKLMPRLDRILKDVEVFADKIARHPEALGVGGALRPSTGLKEAPSGPVPMKEKHWLP